MAYACDSDDGNQAVLLITDLQAGETLALCPVCLPPWIAVMHNELNDGVAVGEHAAPTDPTTGDETDDDQAADGAHHGTEPPTPPLPLADGAPQAEVDQDGGAQSAPAATSSAPGDTSGDSAPVAASG